jgi:hypothetical protein
MKIPSAKSARSSKVACAVFFAFFFLTFAFDAYSKDPTNKLDFDGDGKADIAVYREGAANDRVSSQAYSGSYWYYLGSTSGFASFPWGRTLDVPIPADYAGDSKTDPTIFRWFEPNAPPYDGNTIWISGGGVRGFGNTTGRKMGRNFVLETGGAPQKAELGEFQHVNIYYDQESVTPFYQYRLYWQIGSTNLDYIVTNVPSGQSAATYNQVPVPDDYYNNDGKSEVAVFNTDTGCYHVWQGNPLTDPLTPSCFGSGYTPAPGDYDRDGWVDYGVFKSTGTNSFEWKYISAQSGGSPVTFSLTTTFNGTGAPVAADYDGDGVTDYAVAQSASGAWNWTIRNSGCPSNINLPCSPSTAAPVTFGYSSDTLLASPYFNDPWW